MAIGVRCSEVERLVAVTTTSGMTPESLLARLTGAAGAAASTGAAGAVWACAALMPAIKVRMASWIWAWLRRPARGEGLFIAVSNGFMVLMLPGHFYKKSISWSVKTISW